jgi:hypothetical protein
LDLGWGETIEHCAGGGVGDVEPGKIVEVCAVYVVRWVAPGEENPFSMWACDDLCRWQRFTCSADNPGDTHWFTLQAIGRDSDEAVGEGSALNQAGIGEALRPFWDNSDDSRAANDADSHVSEGFAQEVLRRVTPP